MITAEAFNEMALSFPNTEQVSHFDRAGFKVIGKRMFATYFDKDNTANIFLAPAEQAVFCQIDSENIYPVPNKWGEKGATTFTLDHITREIVMAALDSAYQEIISSKHTGVKKS
jgi:hypothetical protein